MGRAPWDRCNCVCVVANLSQHIPQTRNLSVGGGTLRLCALTLSVLGEVRSANRRNRGEQFHASWRVLVMQADTADRQSVLI